MRFLISTLILFFSLITYSSVTQEQTKIPAGITVAIKAGNATELAKYMNSTVELLLLDKEDFYKKVVAETYLKTFQPVPYQGFFHSSSGSKK